MKLFYFKEKWFMKKVFGMFFVVVMLVSVGIFLVLKVQVVGMIVILMEYFLLVDGFVILKFGVGKVSYGFVMFKFNGGFVIWSDVYSDVGVNVKVGSNWVDIDQVGGYIYN